MKSKNARAYDVKGNYRDDDDSDSDKSDIELEVNNDDRSDGGNEIRRPFIADVEYGNEFGYSLIRTLRGYSTGRRLKRDLFKQAASQLFSSVAVIIMSDQAARNFTVTNFFTNSVYGKSLLSLWWLISIIGLLLGLSTMFMIYHWASLVTNRELLSTVLKIYMLIQLVNWIFVLATLVTTFQTFGEHPRYDTSLTVKTLFPFYLASVFFLLPYLLCICCYNMDLSYLNDELEFGGSIDEPDAHPDTWDLSGLSLEECVKAMIAYPVALLYQTLELLVAVYNLILRIWRRILMYFADRALRLQQEAARDRDKKKRKGLTARIAKTASRWLGSLLGKKKDAERRYKARESEVSKESEQALRLVEQAREEVERMEKDREALEQERQRQRDREELIRREAAEIGRADRERRQKEAEEKARKEAEEAAVNLSPTLSVVEFKALWSTLSVAGQFQCKLKENPNLMPFTEHLRKQGFHIVFGSTPSPNDVEIGVCNIKEKADEPRFMARFLSSQLAFSAVMKSENVDAVPMYVKKFALAKLLKIDTSKAK